MELFHPHLTCQLKILESEKVCCVQKSLQGRKHVEKKEKMLVTSIFSFS